MYKKKIKKIVIFVRLVLLPLLVVKIFSWTKARAFAKSAWITLVEIETLNVNPSQILHLVMIQSENYLQQ